MLPQILQQLGSQNPMMAMIKQAKAVLGTMGNPEAMLMQIANNNPIVRQTINQYGSVEGAINALCKQKGVDPQELMKELSGIL